MWRAVLSTVAANWARLVLTFTTVLIGAAFVSSSMIFAESLAEGQAGLPDDLAVLVTAERGPGADNGQTSQHGGGTVDEQVRQQMAALPGVSRAAGVVDGYAAVVGHDGKLVVTPGFDVRMSGSNWTGTGRMRLDAGRPPSRADEVALAGTVARSGQLAIGDTVRVLHGAGTTSATVTGLYTYRPHGQETAAAPGVAFDTPTAQRLLLGPGQYRTVELSTAAGATPRQVADQAAAVLPAGLVALDRDQLGVALDEQVRSLTASVQATAVTFTAIALLVGCTLIVNTFAMLVARRSRELALLRAVGATRAQIRRTVLAEAALVGLAGSAVGFLVGVGLAYPAMAYAASFDPTLARTVTISPLAAAVTLTVGALTTVLSAWLPARRAARVPPATALRTTPVEAARSPRWRRWLGLLLAVPAAAALAGGAAGSSDGNGLLGMLGALLLLLATLLLVPAISGPAVRLLDRPLRHRGSLALAVQNIQRTPRRTAATASALLIGVALTTGIAVFAASITTEAIRTMGGVLAGDLIVNNVAGGPINQDVQTSIHRLPGVSATTTMRTAILDVDGQPTRAGAIDVTAIDTTVHLDLAGATPTDLYHGVFVAQELADQRGWSPGQHITLRSTRGGSHQVTVAAVIPGSPLLGQVVLAPPLADRHFPPGAGNPLLVAPAPGTDPHALARELETVLADRPDLRVLDPEAYVRSLITEVDAFLGLSGGLLGLSLLIAFLGIINTLTLSVTERTREIGLLRAVGTSRRQIRTMVRTESLLLAAIGGLFGLATGLVLGAMMQHFILSQPVLSLTVPWQTMALCLLGLTTGGLTAAAWPARRAAHTNVLQAIAAE